MKTIPVNELKVGMKLFWTSDVIIAIVPASNNRFELRLAKGLAQRTVIWNANTLIAISL